MSLNKSEFEFEYKGISISPVDPSRFNLYIDLFRTVFPNFKVNIDYLRWLYLENPRGDFVGFDAMEHGKVVAHYACIPTKIEGHSQLSLLALNTATDMAYQGRGLLKVIANATYSRYQNSFSNVIGVANAQAVGALTRHLGFRHLGNLDLRFGKVSSGYLGRRIYTREDLEWRAKNPIRPLKVSYLSERFALTSVYPFTRLLGFKSLVPLFRESDSFSSKRAPFRMGITLDWRSDSKPLIYLPSRFKPSPLSLVYRPLLEDKSDNVFSWTFPDFDAF
jgi:hypothetical protein